jgi:hypothetical protein
MAGMLFTFASRFAYKAGKIPNQLQGIEVLLVYTFKRIIAAMHAADWW